MNIDKIKKALQCCSEKKCDECPYNRWIYGVCQTHLCRDTLKFIEKRGNDYGN